MKLTCFDRRIKIFLYLCRHRKANTRDLAREFSVSRKTIIRDIMILSKYVPLYTKFGRYGGVFIMDDYRNELFLHLSKDEEQLLKMFLIDTFKNLCKELYKAKFKPCQGCDSPVGIVLLIGHFKDGEKHLMNIYGYINLDHKRKLGETLSGMFEKRI